MATSEEGVPSDEGAQAVAGAPAEETAIEQIDSAPTSSSEGCARMDNGAGVREGEDEGEDHATGKKRKKRDAHEHAHSKLEMTRDAVCRILVGVRFQKAFISQQV